jgi:protein-S-isoprenylcysteine O-methyltransferase Ste14
MSSLRKRAFGGLLAFFLVMAALIFAAAGTFDYWQAWTFLAVYFAATLLLTLYLVRKDPALAERRMSGGPWSEKEPAQRVIMSLATVGFIGLMVLPGIDRRLSWSQLPAEMVLFGDALVLAGSLGIFYVFRENSFSSATIEIAADQRVISTGPYAYVRHPMYMAALVMLFGIPVALGSAWGLVLVLAMIPALIWRLVDEERFLARNLPGYDAYRSRVRYRLLPFIW